MSSSIDKHVTFDLPPIKEEEQWECYESPLTKYMHPKLCLNLIDPRRPQKYFLISKLSVLLYLK